MLLDVAIYPNAAADPVLAVISDGKGGPARLKRGLYICNHWNFEMCFDSREFEKWPDLEDLAPDGEYFSEYGVCDSVEQFEQHPLGKALSEHPTRQFVVSFVHISKAEQPATGGWRWHKWGDYIGKGEPQFEYIKQETGFEDGVFTFHVYEKVTLAPKLDRARDALNGALNDE